MSLGALISIAERLATETPPASWLQGSGYVAAPGRWPCCSFVALALHEASGRGRLAPADVASAVRSGWWAAANVWLGEGPWSALEAAREVLPWGGTDADGLAAVGLHVVQTWDGSAPGSGYGHTWLAWVTVPGAQPRGHRLESSIARRVRVDGQPPGAPLGGGVSLRPTAPWWRAVSLALPSSATGEFMLSPVEAEHERAPLLLRRCRAARTAR